MMKPVLKLFLVSMLSGTFGLFALTTGALASQGNTPSFFLNVFEGLIEAFNGPHPPVWPAISMAILSGILLGIEASKIE